MKDSYNRLSLIKKITNGDNKGNEMWLFQCKCGNKKETKMRYVKYNKVRSCGCLRKEKFMKLITKHGLRYTPFYQVWQHMIKRCNSEKCSRYKDYGLRGIKIVWKDFKSFRDDMYDTYNTHYKLNNGDTTIERIDNNGDYSNKNCKWVTLKEQQNNKRNNLFVCYRGETKTVAEWADILKVKYSSLYSRIRHYKWSIEDCINIPFIKYQKIQRKTKGVCIEKKKGQSE